jgi:hypothetical protein
MRCFARRHVATPRFHSTDEDCMANDETGHQHGIPARREEDRLEHESAIVDQRPREKKRDLATWSLWALGVVAGAAVFDLGRCEHREKPWPTRSGGRPRRGRTGSGHGSRAR